MEKKKLDLCYIGENLFYSYKNKIRHIVSKINFNDIKGILYGPKCSTYRFVKDCKPWNCFSIVLNTRTYDFETLKYSEYIDLINNIKSNPKILNNQDFLGEINNNKRLWMNINYGNFIKNSHKINLNIWYKQYQNNWSNDENVCSICLCDFNNGKCIKNLKCNHFFHTNCIDAWLKHKPSCPICRLTIS